MAQIGVRVGPVGVGIGAPYYDYYGGCGSTTIRVAGRITITTAAPAS